MIGFTLSALTEESLSNSELRRLCHATKVVHRAPPDPNVVYDPLDPDLVEVILNDGSSLRKEAKSLIGSPSKPMSADMCRMKFDQCLSQRKTPAKSEALWNVLSEVKKLDELMTLQGLFSATENVLSTWFGAGCSKGIYFRLALSH